MTFQVGSKVGDYEIVGILGRGGMGGLEPLNGLMRKSGSGWTCGPVLPRGYAAFENLGFLL